MGRGCRVGARRARGESPAGNERASGRCGWVTPLYNLYITYLYREKYPLPLGTSRAVSQWHRCRSQQAAVPLETTPTLQPTCVSAARGLDN